MSYPWKRVFWAAAKEGLKTIAWNLFKALFGAKAEEKPKVKKRKAKPR